MSRWVIRSWKKVEEEPPVVNLTPLIDVVFVILIIFIVIAPMLDVDRVELADASQNPKDETISLNDSCPISIHVHKDDTIWLNQQRVNLVQLIEGLKIEKEAHPDVRPQLFNDRDAHFGAYQSVKNAVEAAGFHEMDIVLKPQ